MINKKVLWKVPVYSILAGTLSRWLWLSIIIKFLPDDGMVILYISLAIVLLLTLLIGGFLFREMTKKEIFLSATIVVVWSVFWLMLWRGSIYGGHDSLYNFCISMNWIDADWWGCFIEFIFLRLTQSGLFAGLAGCFAPYLFIPFGKKESGGEIAEEKGEC